MKIAILVFFLSFQVLGDHGETERARDKVSSNEESVERILSLHRKNPSTGPGQFVEGWYFGICYAGTNGSSESGGGVNFWHGEWVPENRVKVLTNAVNAIEPSKDGRLVTERSGAIYGIEPNGSMKHRPKEKDWGDTRRYSSNHDERSPVQTTNHSVRIGKTEGGTDFVIELKTIRTEWYGGKKNELFQEVCLYNRRERDL